MKVAVTEEPVTMTLKNAATWWATDVLLNARQDHETTNKIIVHGG